MSIDTDTFARLRKAEKVRSGGVGSAKGNMFG
jgi:hypothetical protein